MTNFSQGKRGAIDPVGAGKTRITIRIDDDVLAWFREQVHLAGGGKYQILINEALRARVQHQHELLDSTFSVYDATLLLYLSKTLTSNFPPA